MSTPTLLYPNAFYWCKPFNIIQMLLVRSGIETNPGPTNQERIPNIRAKKQNILSVLIKLKSNPPSQRMIGEVARNLNNLLFEDIFTREKAAHVRNVNQRAALKRRQRSAMSTKVSTLPQKKPSRH